MMVVVTIIALFAALVGPKVLHQADRATVANAHADINGLTTALGSYKLDTGAFPATEQGLKALREKPDGVEDWKVLTCRRTSGQTHGSTPTCIATQAITETTRTSSATSVIANQMEKSSAPTSSVGKTS
jgi:type II secretory pathway pseudopilin PulG